jgi:RNA polymerase sigma-70 factor (ECF subfamily)
MADEGSRVDEGVPPGQFPQTRWSVVLAACNVNDSGRSAAALDDLCRAYWFPLYVYIRRRGISPEDAEDLTQGYFAALIEKNYLAQADRERGKLRSFLLTTLKHYLADEWSKANALKRGSGRTLVSIDAAEAEQRYALEPVDEQSPDRLFEKRWALTLLDNVLEALRADYVRSGQDKIFDALKKFLAWNSASEAYREAAAELGLKENAVRVAVFRMRRRYGDLLRAQVADTVASPEEVAAELDYLFSLLRS